MGKKGEEKIREKMRRKVLAKERNKKVEDKKEFLGFLLQRA